MDLVGILYSMGACLPKKPLEMAFSAATIPNGVEVTMSIYGIYILCVLVPHPLSNSPLHLQTPIPVRDVVLSYDRPLA